MTVSDKDSEKLACRVTLMREGLGMSQAELHRKSEISKSTICKIEAGFIAIKLSTAVKLSKALGVSLNVIAGIEEIPAWMKNAIDS